MPAVIALATGAAGCLDRPIEILEPRATSTIVEVLPQSKIEKIDLLLAIDNSRSMADKQAILALAVPDLIEGLLNPPCVTKDGSPIPAAEQPKAPTEICPTGTRREFDPVFDVHIGIVSSSIGGHGGDRCQDVEAEASCGGASNVTQNDHGHLLSRTDACTPDEKVSTYAQKGFLAWDPKQQLKPVGEGALGTIDGSEPGLVPAFAKMVTGVGQIGCGYESQLESVYRFLVDPTPYGKIEVVNDKIKKSEVDSALLTQRRDFLRPDSLLAILMLTDENDCSIKESGFAFIASSKGYLPKPRAICATDPNNVCCTSCALPAAEGCPVDPTCKNAQGKVAYYSNADTSERDDTNLRCFDQKRRFGIDFLYPTRRYIDAFKSPVVADRDGELKPNPLYPAPDPENGIFNVRTPGLVFLAGIVGVPWQDIARNPKDLTSGFKSTAEMAADGTWDLILGDPAAGKLPLDPLMQESVKMRQGKNPVTGAELDTTPETPRENPINGNEWDTKQGDLQYACIFDLKDAQDCANDASCECASPNNKNPLCDETNRQSRVRAKAYPGTRHLEVLQGLETQGIVASACPAQMDDAASSDYGYRPAIGAVVDRLKTALTGQCLPRSLDENGDGRVNCLVIEARATNGACSCDPANARVDLVGNFAAAADEAMKLPAAQGSGWDCFCGIPQLTGDALKVCQNDASDDPVMASGEPVSGFCYVDATTNPPLGNEEIVQTCPANEQRLIRLVGKGEPVSNGTLIITCTSEDQL